MRGLRIQSLGLVTSDWDGGQDGVTPLSVSLPAGTAFLRYRFAPTKRGRASSGESTAESLLTTQRDGRPLTKFAR